MGQHPVWRGGGQPEEEQDDDEVFIRAGPAGMSSTLPLAGEDEGSAAAAAAAAAEGDDDENNELVQKDETRRCSGDTEETAPGPDGNAEQVAAKLREIEAAIMAAEEDDDDVTEDGGEAMTWSGGSPLPSPSPSEEENGKAADVAALLQEGHQETESYEATADTLQGLGNNVFIADVPASSRPSLSPEAEAAFAEHDGLSEILSPSEQEEDGHGFDCPCDECKVAYGAEYVRVSAMPVDTAAPAIPL